MSLFISHRLKKITSFDVKQIMNNRNGTLADKLMRFNERQQS